MSDEPRTWFEGRFLDGRLTLLLSAHGEIPPGYAVRLDDGRIFRNGEFVGYALSLSYDRDALGWWVAYRSWHGSALDMGLSREDASCPD
jgi:hypothetical protein